MIKKITATVVFTFVMFSFLHAQVSLDKVVAIIGNEAILESDIDMLYKDLQMQGGFANLKEGDPRCQILKIFIDQKLLVAQAKQDSLVPNTENIHNNVDRKIAAMIAQYGKDELEAYFKKSIEQFREESLDFQLEQAFANSMQSAIVKKIKITPKEVEKFFHTMSNDSVPIIIPDQYVIYEIVKKPNSEKAILDVKEKLLGLRKRIVEGEKFQTLATLYSEDDKTAPRGGEWGLGALESNVAPIRLALSNMRIGQVSKIIESEYGFHILQLLEKQDETGLVNYRQILLKPKYSLEDQAIGFARLDSIVTKINADSITFERAALKYSENEKSSAGNGLMVNSSEYSMEIRTSFYKDELNPDDFRALEHLETGEISKPYAATDVKSGSVQYKVIMLKEFIPAHTINLKDDFNHVSRMYENKKQTDAIEEWVSKKAKTEYIRINEKYRQCPFVDSSWVF